MIWLSLQRMYATESSFHFVVQLQHETRCRTKIVALWPPLARPRFPLLKQAHNLLSREISGPVFSAIISLRVPLYDGRCVSRHPWPPHTNLQSV